MAKAKAGLEPSGHLEIVPPSSARTALTPPEGAAAFGQMSLGPTPAPHVAWACQLFSFLDKATRTDPAQRSATHLAPYARDFAQWLEQYCEFFGPLTTQVRPFSLLLDGEIVYQDQKYHGIASRLFRDGIVALTWSPGVPSDEILAWMLILLNMGPHDDEDEIDLAVRLWQAGFSHITVDMYDKTPTPPPEIVLQREQIVEELQHQMRDDPLMAVNFYGLRAAPDGDSEPRPVFAGIHVAREHKRAIQSQLESEEASLALRADEFFLFALTQLKESRDVKLLEKWLQPVVGALVTSRAYHELAFLLDDLIALGGRVVPALAEEYNALQGRLFTHLTQTELLQSLLQGIEGRVSLPPESRQPLWRLFRQLADARGEAFFDELGAVSANPARVVALVYQEEAS